MASAIPLSTLAATNTTGEGRFTKFLELPIEIQDMVWDFAVAEAANVPRVHTIRETWKVRRDLGLPGYQYSHGTVKLHFCKNVTPAPALLHTCHGSRRAAFKQYELRFNVELLYPMYFNPLIDTLAFENYSALRKFVSDPQYVDPWKDFEVDRAELDCVRKIAITLIPPYLDHDEVDSLGKADL